MAARIGPWVAAALVGAVALAVCLGVAQLIPIQYSATGQLTVPQGALRATGGAWPDASQVNRWLARPLPVRPIVKIEMAGGGNTAKSPQVLVVAEALNATDAASAVNQVLELAQHDLLSEGARFAAERHRSLLTMLHHARAERARVQRELDELTARRLRESAGAPPELTTPPLQASSVNAPPVPSVRQRNPLWDDLARQVGEMEGRRAGLLQTMTEAHPVIRDLDWQLSQMREQLRVSPEFTSAPDPGVIGPLPPVESGPVLVPAVVASEPSVPQVDLRQQRNRVATADRQLGVAVQQERAAWQELSSLRSELQSCVTRAVAPAHPNPSVAREQVRWGGALLALALAGATAWRSRPRRQVLRTIDDVRRTLKLPVLGKLSAPAR